MKITEVEIFNVDLTAQLKRPWNPVVVRIQTDEGLVGAGEVALAYGTGSN